MIRLEIPILFLEYYASGGTVGIVESSDAEAKRFTYETNWYIGTIAGDFRSNVHGLFFAINGVGGFTNGHNNFTRAKSVGNGACIVIPYYISANSFTKSTEWYESTILSNVWSSIFNVYNIVVNNEVVGTDGHNNSSINWDILFAESVSQSTCVDLTTIFYSDNDVSSGSLICINADSTSTFFNSSIFSCYIDNCIFNTLFSYISAYRITGNIFHSVAVFIFQSNFNGIVLSDWARSFVKVKGDSFSNGWINNSDFLSLAQTFVCVDCIEGHFGTEVCRVRFWSKSNDIIRNHAHIWSWRACNRVGSSVTYNDITASCSSLNTIFVYIEELSSVWFTSLSSVLTVDFDGYWITSFSQAEGSFYAVVVRKGQTNSVFPFFKVSSAYILECEGVYAISIIIGKEYVAIGQLSASWLINDFYIFCNISVIVVLKPNCFSIPTFVILGHFVAIFVYNLELNSIAEIWGTGQFSNFIVYNSSDLIRAVGYASSLNSQICFVAVCCYSDGVLASSLCLILQGNFTICIGGGITRQYEVCRVRSDG